MLDVAAAIGWPPTHGVWPSLVGRLLWEQEIAGSNPVTPTTLSWYSVI